jgi:hypothetical protein
VKAKWYELFIYVGLVILFLGAISGLTTALLVLFVLNPVGGPMPPVPRIVVVELGVAVAGAIITLCGVVATVILELLEDKH